MFLPKLVSTGLSSIWILGFIEGQLPYLTAVLLMPLIALVGVFVSLMVASMVKNQDSMDILRKGFFEALSRWRMILLTAVFFIVIGFITAIPLSLGVFHFAETGSRLFLITGLVISLSLIAGIGFFSYFLPITLLEKDSFISGFGRSVESTWNNSREVALLSLFSFGLLALAFGSSSYLRALGYIGFLLGRGISTVVNTYLFVISPSYYLEN